MDLLTKDAWNEDWREMLADLRPQRFVSSYNPKVGNYVNVLSYDDVFFLEKNMNTLFGVDNLNFFEGLGSLPAFTSMDGQKHRDRKIPMKDFLSNASNLDYVIDNFFEKLDDEFDAHLDFSYDVISELLDVLFGIDKSNNKLIHQSLVHLINGNYDKIEPLTQLFVEMYADPKGFSLITKEVSSGIEEFVGNMILAPVGIHALGSAIELCIKSAADYGIDRDADERFYKETLRYNSPIPYTLRRSLVDWNGFKAGTVFAVWFNSANLDPSMFEDPLVFNPERHNLNNHFAFSFGPHRCIGRSISNKILDRLIHHIRQYDWKVYDFNIDRYPVVHISDLWVSRSKR